MADKFYGVATRLDAVRIESLVPLQIIGLVPCVPREYRPDFCIPVLAQATYTDALKNDINTFLFKLQTETQPFDFRLEQKNSSGSWVDLTSLVGGGYGQHYGVGSFEEFPTYVGQILDWQLIYQAYGAGEFRFVLKYGFAWLPSQTMAIYSPEFNLRPFSDNAANSTVRIETYTSGNMGSLSRAPLLFLLDELNWYDSIRLEGYFGKSETTYTEVNIKYQTGIVQKVRDEQLETYQLSLGLTPYYLLERLKTYGLKADNILVTDYNLHNENLLWRRMKVKKSGGFKPDYNYSNPLARVTFTLEDSNQTLYKNRC
jgi:hypothetical protein